MAKTCILIILDGLGDRAFPCFGSQTPLEAARTPFLDALASRGSCGLFHAARLGQALPSENAHFAFFGYGPEEFPGRGHLEALGWGISIKPGGVAFLAHLSSVSLQDGVLFLEQKRPDLTGEQALELVRAVEVHDTWGARFRFHPTYGVDGILTASGHVSRYVTDSDTMNPGAPLCAVRPWDSHKDDPRAQTMARSLYEYLRFAHQTLDRHPVNQLRRDQGKAPANAVVTQRAGAHVPVRPFVEKWGLPALSISSGALYHGLALFLGMDVIKDADTGDPGKDLARRVSLALEKAGRYKLIHVHTKTPDDAAHKKNPLLKKQVIESLDHGLEQALAGRLDDPDLLFVVTSDHSTPSDGPLIHSGEAVPLALCGPGVRMDKVRTFGETACAPGALGHVRDRELLYMILDHLDMSKIHGIMDTPEDQPFWPGNREPLRIRRETS